MELTKEQQIEFKEATKPLIKWLNDNLHPHVYVLVEPTGACLLSAELSYPTDEFIKDQFFKASASCAFLRRI